MPSKRPSVTTGNWSMFSRAIVLVEADTDAEQPPELDLSLHYGYFVYL